MAETTQLNDDKDLLEAVNVEYLSKKKRNRKIIFSIISFITLALATMIIVMSCIKVNLKPEFIKGASRYEITINSSSTTYEKGDKGFEKFDEQFNKAFSINYLTALFDGKLGGYDIKEDDETKEKFYSDTTNNIGMSTDLKNHLGKNYVRVIFDSPKVVTYSNGKEYKCKLNSDYNLKFTELYFPLTSNQEEETLTFYLGTNGYRSYTTITKITVEANSYSLYKFVAED